MQNQKIYSALVAAILAVGFNFMVTKKWFPKTSTTTLSTFFLNPDNTPKQTSTIQVALLLDTSSSMNGLIEQAKSQLWQILNLLAKTERQQQETKLEIALYEYGNPSRSTHGRQIRQLSGFTNDMDLISERLFALRTNGGEEYCGQVIKASIDELEWKKDDSNIKMIYIAGNEPFTQGPINYAQACQLAKKRNITVNTIFCGACQDGVNGLWKQGAQLADGEYMCINQNQATSYVETPYDKKINDLNKKLNETYIPYGAEGKNKKESQSRQDSNAASYSYSNAAERADFKSSGKYKADSWDIVDAYEKDKSILKKAKVLPDSLQTLSVEDLEKKIEQVATQRTKIQIEIQTMNSQRLQFIEENSKPNADDNNLKLSIQKSIEKQAKKKGYKIKN